MAQNQSVFKYSLVEVIILSVVVIIASFFTYNFGKETQMNDYLNDDNNFSSNANVARQGNTQIQTGNVATNGSTGNMSANTIPKPSPYPTPDLSDLVFDLPENRGIVEDLLLYESANESLDKNRRKYGKTFLSSSTRYVNATLLVRLYGGAAPESLKVVFYENDTLKKDCSQNVSMTWELVSGESQTYCESQQTDSKGRNYSSCYIDLTGCGNKKFGSWKVGTGRVELKYQEKVLISKDFEVR